MLLMPVDVRSLKVIMADRWRSMLPSCVHQAFTTLLRAHQRDVNGSCDHRGPAGLACYMLYL